MSCSDELANNFFTRTYDRNIHNSKSNIHLHPSPIKIIQTLSLNHE